MKFRILISAILIAGLCVKTNSSAQDNPKPVDKTARDLKKTEWLKQRQADRDRDAALKAHMKHQTKDVRKRMKQDAKKAAKYNKPDLKR